MKIAIIGYSGSGKSTLARKLGEKYGVNVLHLDSVHFLPGWVERDAEEEKRIVETFMDGRDGWVIDGNYRKLLYDRRMEEADLIVEMLFGRLDCLRRVCRRFRRFKGMTRPDMAKGCSEKLDREFVLWVLWKGRRKAARSRYESVRKQYAGKTVVLKNQRQLDAFWDGLIGML